MTNKLETIRTMVAAHEAIYNAAGEAAERVNDDGEPTSIADNDVLYEYNRNHAKFHPVMTLLADLLPTLELMVAWESMESRDMPMPEQTKLYDKLNAAIAALVKDTE